MKNTSVIFSIFVALVVLSTLPVYAVELDSWPREVKIPSGSITIYQPQVESLDGTTLKGRAAIAYNGPEQASPVFGVAWFTSRLQIDRQERIVTYETLEITDTRLPEDDEKHGAEFKKAVQEGMQTWTLESSLDDLTTALAAIKEEQKAAADLKTDPPKIIYTDHPALLVVIDGKALLQKIKNSHYQAVANTPYPLFFDDKSNRWFLNAAKEVWYSSDSVDGPWTFEQKPPADLGTLVESRAQADESQVQSSDSTAAVSADNAPAIIVAHEPTELVVSDGKAGFAPLTDDLLAMANTESDVFMDVKSQQYYLVISGRWYRAQSMDGSWAYISADGLPPSFADIPQDSPYSDIRSYVAGTDEAREAVMDAQIPQTAAVARGVVDIKVDYDGEPKFETISGTDLKCASNSSETVIEAQGKYYLVKDAVWYIADKASGPWQVSDHAPAGIAGVPPSSPEYNTKYVYVYDSTPDVVYVGYTPGYVGSYVYGPTIVYGTGWYYSPWVSPRFYYPRPATWGFSVSYNPWSGWGFGMSWSSGPFHFGFYSGGGYHGPGYRGWWGPGGYRPAFNQVNINNININRNNWNNFSRHNNLYRNTQQRAVVRNTTNARSLSAGDRQQINNRIAAAGQGSSAPGVANNRQPPKEISKADVRNKAAGLDRQDIQNKAAGIDRAGLKNDILSDEKGNVYRNNNGQWQKRTQNDWQNSPVTTKSTSTTRQAVQRSGYDRSSSIDRQQYSRQRAAARSHGARSHGGGGRAGGMRR